MGEVGVLPHRSLSYSTATRALRLSS
jgi:hypothetical protein